MNPGRRRHPLIGIGVAQDIEPMPRVPDGVLFIGEQTVNDRFIGLRGSVR